MTRAPRPPRTGQGMTACGMQELFDSPEVLRKKVKQLADMIRGSKYTVVYTGAGISTSAGIPDYRGPAGVWTLKARGKDVPEPDLKQLEPTLSHHAIKCLMSRKLVRHVVSQNIDGLHRRSGIHPSQISELHGNYCLESCPSCGAEYFRSFAVWDGLTSAPGSTADSAAIATRAALKLRAEFDGAAGKRVSAVVERQVEKGKSAPGAAMKSSKNKKRKSRASMKVQGNLKLQAAEIPPHQAEGGTLETAINLEAVELNAGEAQAAFAEGTQGMEATPVAGVQASTVDACCLSERAEIKGTDTQVCKPQQKAEVHGEDCDAAGERKIVEEVPDSFTDRKGPDTNMADAEAGAAPAEGQAASGCENAGAGVAMATDAVDGRKVLELMEDQVLQKPHARPEIDHDHAETMNEDDGQGPSDPVTGPSFSNLPGGEADTDGQLTGGGVKEHSLHLVLEGEECAVVEHVESAGSLPEVESAGEDQGKDAGTGSKESGQLTRPETERQQVFEAVIDADTGAGADGAGIDVDELAKTLAAQVSGKGEQAGVARAWLGQSGVEMEMGRPGSKATSVAMDAIEPVVNALSEPMSVDETLPAGTDDPAPFRRGDREKTMTNTKSEAVGAMHAAEEGCLEEVPFSAKPEADVEQEGDKGQVKQEEAPAETPALLGDADCQPKDGEAIDSWLHNTNALLVGGGLMDSIIVVTQSGGEAGEDVKACQGAAEDAKESGKAGPAVPQQVVDSSAGSQQGVIADKPTAAGRSRRTRAYLGPVSDLSGTKVNEALEILRSRAGKGLPLHKGVTPGAVGQGGMGPADNYPQHDHRTGRKCERKGCDGDLVDSVVLFGESMPPKALEDAEYHSARAEVALVLGSSLRVGPACDFPGGVPEHGGKLVIVNLQRTPMDKKAALVIHARCDEVMELLMAELGLPVKKPENIQEPENRASNRAEAEGSAVSSLEGTGKVDVMATTAAGKGTSDGTSKALGGASKDCSSLKVTLKWSHYSAVEFEKGVAETGHAGPAMLGCSSVMEVRRDLIDTLVQGMPLVQRNKKPTMTLAEAVARVQDEQQDGFSLGDEIMSEGAGLQASVGPQLQTPPLVGGAVHEAESASRRDVCLRNGVEGGAARQMDPMEDPMMAEVQHGNGVTDRDEGTRPGEEGHNPEPIVWRSYKRRRNSSEARGLMAGGKAQSRDDRTGVADAVTGCAQGDLPTWVRPDIPPKTASEDRNQQNQQQGIGPSLPPKQVICLGA